MQWTPAQFLTFDPSELGTQTFNEVSKEKLDSSVSAKLVEEDRADDREQLSATRRRIFELSGQSWIRQSGFEAAPFKALLNADAFLCAMFDYATCQRKGWLSPTVTNSPDGEVELEWNKGGRSMIIYADENSVSMLKAWGVNVNTEMEMKAGVEIGEVNAAFVWLVSGPC